MFNEILVRPILNLLLVFYNLFSFFGIKGAFGWSIILLTVSIRLLLSPLTRAQLKSMKKLAEIKPRLDELTRKHSSDKRRLQQEQLKLYQEAGINPAAGCLPVLVQIPVFIALYNVFLQFLGNVDKTQIVEHINKEIYPFLSSLSLKSLDLSFLGFDLATKPNEWQKNGSWLLLVPIITAFLQWLQTKLTVTTQTQKSLSGEKKDGDDFSRAMQTQTTVVFPLMIGFFAYSFPVGVSLYWNTFSIFGIIQQLRLNKKE